MATTAFSRAGQLLRGTLTLTHRLVSLSSTRTKATLPDLPYDYNALEPIISAEIMQLHHSKHHAAYVNNLNIAKEKLATAKDLDEATLAGLKSAIHFNGGGHINHSLFWQMLSPKGGTPGEDFLHAITSSFGSFEQMKSTVSAKAIAVQGSGWGWLAMCPKTGDLSAVTCANQDPLFETTGLVPLFGIDVWEHAYYLQYKNVRADYVNAIWQVANWADIEARYNTVVEQIPPPSFPEDN